MSNNLQAPPSLFGVQTGYMPKHGPKALTYTVDLTTGPQSIDLMRETEADQIEFVQAVHIDNSANATAVTIVIMGTQHRVVCPPQAQGIFTLFCLSNPQFTFSGPAAKIIAIFSNMPLAPNVWKIV